MECFIPIQIKIITDVVKMPGSWGREIGGMLKETETAGRSFRRRPWFKRDCCANDDDDC